MRQGTTTTPETTTVEDLLAELDWLRRLTRRLVHDDHDAQDIAQRTVLSALTHPPTPAPSLRPWLKVVATNLARRLNRDQSRRERLERKAARNEATPSAEALVSRLSVQRSVVEAVSRLKEPYRSTILWRYFERKSVKEIARLQRVPAETVHTRLRRGLDTLRGRLDRQFGERKTWSAPLLLWAHAQKPMWMSAFKVLSVASIAVVLTAVLVELPQKTETTITPQPSLESSTIDNAPNDSQPVSLERPPQSTPEDVPPYLVEHSFLDHLPSPKTDSTPSLPPTSGVDRIARTTSEGETYGPLPPGMLLVDSEAAYLGLDISEFEAFLSNSGEAEPLYQTLLAGCTPRETRAVETFLIAEHETSYRQYKLFLNATGGSPSETLSTTLWNYYDARRSEEIQGDYREEDADLPIGCVSFDDAVACARWMGRRLPSEEEWTAAARREPYYHFVWGKRWDRALAGNRHRPVSVNHISLDRSYCGALALMGNVAEWTSSPYLPFKGFDVSKVRTGAHTRMRAPYFSSDENVAKGGTVSGSQLLNNAFFRQPFTPCAEYEWLGFRTAKSIQAGRDALTHAVRIELKDVLPPGLDRTSIEQTIGHDLCGQEIHYASKEGLPLIEGEDHVAFSRPSPMIQSGLEDQRVLLACFTTTRTVVSPSLSAGSYAVYFIPPTEESEPGELFFVGRDGVCAHRRPVPKPQLDHALDPARLTIETVDAPPLGTLQRVRYEFTEGDRNWRLDLEFLTGVFEDTKETFGLTDLEPSPPRKR